MSIAIFINNQSALSRVIPFEEIRNEYMLYMVLNTTGEDENNINEMVRIYNLRIEHRRKMEMIKTEFFRCIINRLKNDLEVYREYMAEGRVKKGFLKTSFNRIQYYYYLIIGINNGVRLEEHLTHSEGRETVEYFKQLVKFAYCEEYVDARFYENYDFTEFNNIIEHIDNYFVVSNSKSCR